MYKNYIKHYLKKHGFEAFKPKAVLFDMDGVLYNSMPNHVVAWQESMKKFNINMTKDEVYATEGMKGVDTIKMLVKAQKNIEISTEDAQKMYDEKARIFGEMPEATIMPGVQDVMNKMKKNGLEIGIVTGSGQQPLIERALRDFHEFVDKEHMVTAFDVRHGKPAPDPYLMGLKKAGNLLPFEGIVVENAPMGVRAGVAAQIFTIAVNSGPLPNEALSNEGANIVFDTMPKFNDAWDVFFDF